MYCRHIEDLAPQALCSTFSAYLTSSARPTVRPNLAGLYQIWLTLERQLARESRTISAGDRAAPQRIATLVDLTQKIVALAAGLACRSELEITHEFAQWRRSLPEADADPAQFLKFEAKSFAALLSLVGANGEAEAMKTLFELVGLSDAAPEAKSETPPEKLLRYA